MYKYILHLIITVSFFSVSSSIHAQSSDMFWLDGYVRDGFTNENIDKAAVYLLNQDSVLLDSTQTKQHGWSLNIKRSKSFRSCIIKVVHPDYPTQYSAYSLKYLGKSSRFKLPPMYLKRKGSFTEQLLDEVEVTATKVKMFYRGDTLVYNADAFNVANGSMLDALIRQMPGTELTRNGEIFVNGRKINNLLLNGKDFFRGNNKLMLENLPYYTIKEIKVYEQTPEKAAALHDERAKKDFVMDVNLKKEYSTGYMANVEAGAGTEEAYLARLFGLRFTNVSRLAVVGGMNNLNMGDYAFSGNVFGDPARDGRTKSRLLTAELLTENKERKNVLTVELSHRKSGRGADEFQETFHSDASTFSTAQSSQANRNLGASLSNKYTLKVPFWMESTTKLRLNDRKDEGSERYYESGADTRRQGIAVLDSLFGIGEALNDPSMISARKRWEKSKAREYGASQEFNIARKLWNTDVIDLSAGVDYSKSNNETDRYNRYLTWKSGERLEDVLEDIDRPNTHVGAMADVSYKLSRLLFATDLKLFFKYRFNQGKDRETITDGASLSIDRENSYDRRMTEHKYTAGLNSYYFCFHGDVLTICNVTLPVSFIDRSTDYSRHSIDTCLMQSPVFFEPSISLQHKKLGGSNGLLYYDIWYFNASSSLQYSLPDATQLITLPLTSDRLNIYQGNAHLKAPATWTTDLSWKIPFKRRGGYLQQSLSYTNYINRIVNTYRYEDGVYTNRPDNVNGMWNLKVSTRGGLDFKRSSISYGWSVNYQRMKNFAADGTSGQSVQIDNNELRNVFNLQLRSHYKKVSGGIHLSAVWRKPMNDGADIDYHDTWDNRADLWLTIHLPAGIDWETECEFTKRHGYSGNELNRLMCDWSMSLSKSILKDKIDLKLQAIDILHQYKSVAYVVNERGIRETRSVSLPAYLLCSMTYKFNKQPKRRE